MNGNELANVLRRDISGLELQKPFSPYIGGEQLARLRREVAKMNPQELRAMMARPGLDEEQKRTIREEIEKKTYRYWKPSQLGTVPASPTEALGELEDIEKETANVRELIKDWRPSARMKTTQSLVDVLQGVERARGKWQTAGGGGAMPRYLSESEEYRALSSADKAAIEQYYNVPEGYEAGLYRSAMEKRLRFYHPGAYKVLKKLGPTEKSLSDQMVDVLKGKSYKMLTPDKQANLIKTVQAFEEAERTSQRTEEEYKRGIKEKEVTRLTLEEFDDLMRRAKEENWKPWELMSYLRVLGVPSDEAEAIGKVMAPDPGALELAQARKINAEVDRSAKDEEWLRDYAAKHPEHDWIRLGPDRGELILKEKELEETAKKTTEELKIKWKEVGLVERAQDIGHSEFLTDVEQTVLDRGADLQKFMTTEDRLLMNTKSEILQRTNKLEYDYTVHKDNLRLKQDAQRLARDYYGLAVKKYGLSLAEMKMEDTQFWAELGLKTDIAQQAALEFSKKFTEEVRMNGLKTTLANHGMSMDWANYGLDTTKIENDMKKWADLRKEWKETFTAERADEMFSQAMREEELKAQIYQINKNYELNMNILGETEANNLRNYQLSTVKEQHTWTRSMFDMGFKDRESIQTAYQFNALLGLNREKEETRAKEYQQTFTFTVDQEANLMERFGETLKKEYAQIDVDVKRLGLDAKTEARIAQVALWNFTLDWNRLGHLGALLKWEKDKEAKKYWWKEKEWGLTNLKAITSFMGTMNNIIGHAKTSDHLWQVVNKVLVDSLGQDYANLITVLNKEGRAQMEIPEGLSAVLNTLEPAQKEKAMGWCAAAYNTKTEKWHTPNQTQLKDIGEFFLGKEGIQPKELKLDELGCNLSPEAFIQKIAQEPFWSEADKGAAFRMRVDPDLWRGLSARASAKGVLKTEEEEKEKKGKGWGEWAKGLAGGVLGLGLTVVGKATEWRPFGKQKEKPTSTGNIRKDAEGFITRHGMERDDPALRAFLISLGWADWQISDEGIGGQ